MTKTVTRERGVQLVSEEDVARLQRVADFLAYSPDLQELLGGNVDATVSLSDTGSIVFEFAPAP